MEQKLHEVPLEEALDRWFAELEFGGALARMEVETIATVQAVGRVTAAPVVAQISSPHYYQAATDGLAVRSTATFAATRETPSRLKLGPDGVFVDTGSALPDGFDAVVPMHEIKLVSTEEVQVDRPSAPWRNVRPTGEDLAAREVILPRDHRVGPLELGAMLAGGVNQVQVYRQPRVAILPVGTHVVEAGATPGVGQMIDSNSPILAALVEQLGAVAKRFPVTPERAEEVRETLLMALVDYDLVIVVAGPSYGTALVAHLLGEVGECTLNGVAFKPGHTVTMGQVEGKPVLALPFYPVSAFLSYKLFAKPVLERKMGLAPRLLPIEPADLAIAIRSPAGTEEFLRVKLGVVGGRTVAVPISRGAALLMSLVRADGLVQVPAHCEELQAGTRVDVKRLEPVRPIEGNIILLGTHDITYEVINGQLMRAHPELTLFTAATGGKRGLEALTKGLCHLAAMHMFDEEEGDYNLPHVRRAEIPLVLVNLFSRDLGLVVAQGNPKSIQGLEDLLRPEVNFINRQLGSGTRMLMEYHLRQAKLDTSKIKGFNQEAYTHMSAAAAVSSGAADAGLGIPATAKASRLDFVPCFRERLDLAIPKRFFNLYAIQGLLQVIRSSTFRREATAHLAGYDFQQSGTVLWESP